MKITIEELLGQMEVVLKDEFEASVNNEKEKIVLEFTNGQKFKIKIEEL